MGNTISKSKRARHALKSKSAPTEAISDEITGKTPSRFSLLPREIRDEILSYIVYECALFNHQNYSLGLNCLSIDANWVYNVHKLILVSKQFQSEILDALPQRIVARGWVTLRRYLQALEPAGGLNRVKEMYVYIEPVRLHVEKDHVIACKDYLEECKYIKLSATCLGEIYPGTQESLTRSEFIDMVPDYKRDVMGMIVDLVDSTPRDRI
jgi:hypothetical protein